MAEDLARSIAYHKADLVDKCLMKFSESRREEATKRFQKILACYQGLDQVPIDILIQASPGRFDEFADKLEAHFESNVVYLSPESREDATAPQMIKARAFFKTCYWQLGVHSK